MTTIIEVDTATNMASISVHYKGQSANASIEVDSVDKIVLGDVSKKDLNTEFKLTLACKKSLTPEEVTEIIKVN